MRTGRRARGRAAEETPEGSELDGLERAAAVLARGQAVAFTGAGVSAESGIPTFHERGGVWARFDPEDFGTWEGMSRTAMQHPERLAAFLSDLRRVFIRALPNAAHRALAGLEDAGLLSGVVTQNVDGLHREAGSRRVVELHGSLHRRACLACGRTEDVTRQEFVAGLDRVIAALRTAFVWSFGSILPKCAGCGGPTRPDWVLFGETVLTFDEALELVTQARTLLVIGTSGEVQPAAGLVARARDAGALVVAINRGEDAFAADVRLRGRAARVLPMLAAAAARWRGERGA